MLFKSERSFKSGFMFPIAWSLITQTSTPHLFLVDPGTYIFPIVTGCLEFMDSFAFENENNTFL
jgi:hypothetical protein